jgi:hypothetical protein
MPREVSSIYKQILAGLARVETPFVALAEHDCLYHEGHFSFRPTDDLFMYNQNVWFVDYETGIYSYWRRRPLSQLVAKTDRLTSALNDRLLMLAHDVPFSIEPGVREDLLRRVAAKRRFCAENKIPFVTYASEVFRTDVPNLDIRHTRNFTAPKTFGLSSRTRSKLPYWGKFQHV